MSGVRIQHPTKRSRTFTLVDGSRRLVRRFECPGCHRVHEFKTYHFRLDEVGAAIISPEIVERLRRIPGQPFRVTGEVADPPKQRIIVNEPIRVPLGALAPGGARRVAN